MADDFNPYAAPAADLESPADELNVWRQKRLVIYSDGTPLPHRCYRCNQPASLRLSRKLYWTPAWPWLLFFIGPISGFFARHSDALGLLSALSWPVALILVLVLRKRAEVDYGVCARHRKISLWLRGSALLFLAANVGCSYLVATAGSSAAGEPILLLGLLMLGVAMALAIGDSLLFGLSARRIRDGKVWLRGCGSHFLNSLPEYPAPDRPR